MSLNKSTMTVRRLKTFTIVVCTLWVMVLGFYSLAKIGEAIMPTADQLYGCARKQQAPNGECK